MTTDVSADDRKPYRVRHPVKFRVLAVTELIQLSASTLRIVFYSEDLADFVSTGFDDHIKLFFPEQAGAGIVIPTMTESGPIFPEGAKPVMRDYTPYSFDNIAKTLSIDFVIHQAGPATTWAQQAKVGDKLLIAGPRGSMVIPLAFDAYVFFGDDTALPAITRRLQELPPHSKALVVVEVDSEQDTLNLTSPAQVEVVWQYRHGQSAGRAGGFLNAIEYISQHKLWPVGDTYTWVAAETSVARQLRKVLIERFDLDKAYIKAAGYWQHGASGAHTSIGDE